MSNITISNLHPTGSALFSDSESYLKEMSEEELGIQGGIMATVPCQPIPFPSPRPFPRPFPLAFSKPQIPLELVPLLVS